MGSSEYSKYRHERNYASDPIPIFMKQCLQIDIKLSNRIGELSVPKGVELYVEQGLECFQNDEGSVEANAVDMIEDNLCVEANAVDMIEDNLCVEANAVDMIEDHLCVEANAVDMIEDNLCVEANAVDMIEEDLCVEANAVDMIEEDLCVEANDVDMIEEDLCVEAIDVDMIEDNLCVEANAVDMIEEDLCVEANDVDMIEENLCVETNDMIEEDLCVEANDVDMIEEDLFVEANDVDMIEEDLCVEANDVDMIEEDLCGTIWNVTKNCIDRYQTQKPAPVIKGDRTSERLMLYLTFQCNNCLYQNQDEVVADQIWICGNDILRSTLSNFWKGRCARVQAVMEIVLLPSLKNIDTSLGDNDISRRKRVYTPDPLVKIDSIGQPRDIPNMYKAQNEIAA